LRPLFPPEALQIGLGVPWDGCNGQSRPDHQPDRATERSTARRNRHWRTDGARGVCRLRRHSDTTPKCRRWPSSLSSPPSNGGVPSTHPTSSLSSGPEPGSRRASWSNVPTNQEAISKSHDTPIPPVLTIAHVLVKVLQTSVDDDDEKASASCRIHPFPFDAWVSQG
jgi:hypothetical protein